ncbi:methylthioribulose 1-phosphate dehydratase [Ferviditalea candida]|uniref:Methylthioribulose-1-phosphate dehydratase n=1 Tax=Ferviditalea candida TaxID=3108399 RepID=A0ABU5ZHH6_9BACL|nr:methylthioribulose 1-phosphate dehydratase [Paenibacillaceae bacterium T2]
MIPSTYSLEDVQKAFGQLREIKSILSAKGWFPATSGNLSVRLSGGDRERFAFAVTASGKDKSVQTAEDFLVVDERGRPLETTALKPSAETLIHCEIYQATGCGAVFHVHTVFNNLASELFHGRGSVPVSGVELIKAFNIWEEEAHIEIPILPNYADIPRIAAMIKNSVVPEIPGILLRKHGIYAWGKDAAEAKKHLEAFEFLFEYEVRLRQLGS